MSAVVDCDRRHQPSTESYHSSSPQEKEAGSTESGRRARAHHLVGTVLIDRFELVSLLGIGAFGEVYQARDRQNPNTALAVKILRRPSAQALYRFKREFRALGEWSHPNLVSLHDLFLDSEHAFFSMELVAGVDFHRHVRPDGTLSKERLLSALEGLCEGVSALHERGRLHRDLKPANVLVEPNGRVVIVDLGLATLFGRGAALGSEHGFVGTVQYAAPEQLSSGVVGPETDWYAVGTMLYDALSGSLPYDAAFSEQLQQKSRPPAALPPEGDELDPLRRLCVELLHPDRKLRAGGAELRAALGRGVTSTIVSDPPFVGRSEQLSTLDGLFQEVERGASRVALVSAPSGLGKTALVERFLRDLAMEHRATVLRGRCYVNEEVTYQAVDGNIDALSHHLSNLPRAQVAAILPRDVRSLSTLFPVLNRVDAIASAPPVRSLDDKVSLRERASSALRDLTARLSDRLPVVLFIDDIQWDDEDSAWLLCKLLAEPDPPAVMLIATCRAELRNESRLLRALKSEHSTARLAHEIVLPTLTSEETATLAGYASNVVLAQPALASRIAEESGGHPMFALELARYADRSALDPVDAPRLSLDAALLGRSAQLSPAARRLLEIVCVAGRPLKYTVALAAAECEIDAVREVVSSKLVTISGTARDDTLSVYHDRIRDSELSALPEERVRALHGLLADALAADGQRFDLIVDHYLAAGRRDRAAKYALRAADSASSVLAFNRLPALLLLAIENPDEKQPSQLYTRLAESYGLLGLRGAAAEAYRKASTLEPDPDQRWELASLAMWQAFHAQELPLGFSLLRQLDQELGRERLRPTFWRIVESVLRGIWLLIAGPPKLQARAEIPDRAVHEKRMRLAFRAYMALLATHGEYSMFYAIEAFRLSARLGDTGIYAASLSAYATSLSLSSGRASKRVERLLDQAQTLAEAQPDQGVQRLVECLRLVYTHATGHGVVHKLLPMFEAEYPPTPFGTFLRSLLIYTLAPAVLFWSGRIARARVLGAQAIGLAREFSDPHVEAGLRATTAFRLLADDDAETAWAEWYGCYQRYPDHTARLPVTFGMVLALYQQRFDHAALVLSNAWRFFFYWDAYVRPSRSTFFWWWGAVSAARIARGENSRGLHLRLWFASWLVRIGMPPTVEPYAISLGATRALLYGHSARGIELLERAKLGFDACDMRLFSACASHALAELHDDATRAREHAAFAADVFAEEKIKNPERWLGALFPGLDVLVARRNRS